ncbi:MAG: DUF4126 domain-containing protein [Chloroflexota bacterium]|nr:DUF4126 domain-containing protein [Chloroflexota bacterium]
MLTVLLTTLGLSLPAGLNAWIPLLILALSDRFTDQIELGQPYDFISSTPGIVIILLLLPIELFADKVPGVDHISDIIHTFVRPIVGAVIAAGVADGSQDLNVLAAAAIGLTGAGATHAVKMSARPVITVSTGGVGNPITSMVEDTIAAISALIAVFFPLILLVLLPLLVLAMVTTWQRLKRGSARFRRLSPRSG